MAQLQQTFNDDLFLLALQMELVHNLIRLLSVATQRLPVQYVLVHYLKIMTT